MSRDVTNLLYAAEDASHSGAAPDSPSTPEADPTTYQLSAWCVVPLVMTVLLSAIGPYVMGHTSEPRSLAISLVALVCGALFWSWVIYLISGKTRKAADVGFCVVLVLSTAARFAVPALNIPLPAQAAAFGLGNAAPAAAQEVVVLSPYDKALARWQNTATPLNAAFERVSDEFRLAGAADPASLNSHVEVMDRISLLTRLSNAHSARAGYAVAASVTFAKFLAEQGCSPAEVSHLTDEFSRDPAVQLERPQLEATSQYIQACQTTLQLLRDRYGQWQVTPDTLVHFKREVDANLYNSQQAAMRQALALMQAPRTSQVATEDPDHAK